MKLIKSLAVAIGFFAMVSAQDFKFSCVVTKAGDAYQAHVQRGGYAPVQVRGTTCSEVGSNIRATMALYTGLNSKYIREFDLSKYELLFTEDQCLTIYADNQNRIDTSFMPVSQQHDNAQAILNMLISSKAERQREERINYCQNVGAGAFLVMHFAIGMYAMLHG